MHRDAVAWHPDVNARVPRRPAQLDGLAVAERVQRAELGAEVAVMGEGRDGTVDVELRVRARVAAVRDGEADQLVPRGMERFRPGTAQLTALREGQLAERGPAAGARMVERLAEIDARGSGARERLFRSRVHQG